MPAQNYSYSFTKTAKKDIDGLHSVIRTRLAKKLKYFLESGDPLQFAEKLTGFPDADYRFRIGVYRATFILEGKIIYIVRVQHRKDVYK